MFKGVVIDILNMELRKQIAGHNRVLARGSRLAEKATPPQPFPHFYDTYCIMRFRMHYVKCKLHRVELHLHLGGGKT